MFGSSAKIEALEKKHKEEIQLLKSQNEDLQATVNNLEAEVLENLNNTDDTRNEVLAILLKSYDSGSNFILKNIEGNLLMLDDINKLNALNGDKMLNVGSETRSIANNIETIQEFSNQLGDDSNSLNESVLSIV